MFADQEHIANERVLPPDAASVVSRALVAKRSGLKKCVL
jgi:hypothetical protein